MLTYDEYREVSYLKVLKIHRREEVDRSASFAEHAEKQDLIDSVKTNLIENGMSKRVQFSNDNYKVTVDAEKQSMKIAKRGQATIAMKKVELPKQ